MRLSFRRGNHRYAVDVVGTGEERRVAVDDREYLTTARYLDDDTLALEVDGRSHVVHLARDGRERFVAVAGEIHHLLPEARDSAHAEMGALAEPEVRAPMPGKVLQVLVAPGQRLEAGDGLLLLEAMKMENRLTAPAEAEVVEVRVEAGEMVDGGQVLVVLRYLEPPAGANAPRA